MIPYSDNHFFCQGKLKFIFAFQPGPGHWSRISAIASELRLRGHQIIMATSKSFRQHVPGDSCDDFIAIGPSWEEDKIEPAGSRKARSVIGELRNRGDAIASYFFGAAREVFMDLTRALQEEPRPDMLVLDYTLLGAGPAGEALGIPWATVFGLTVPFHIAGWPPFGSHFSFARSAVIRERYAKIEKSIMHENRKLYQPIRALWQAAGRSVTDPWQAYARLGRLGIVGSIKECEFPLPRNFPKQIHYVGPLVEKSINSSELDGEIAGFIHRQDSPLVHVTLGMTFSMTVSILRRIIDALKDDPLRLLISTGRLDPNMIQQGSLSVKAELLIRQTVPHFEVMSGIDVLICHGGAGTLMKALYFGVPVVVVPLGAEQRSNGARLAHAGIGKMILPARLTPNSIREAVYTLLDPARGFIRRAKEMGEKARQAGGAGRAATLLERSCQGAMGQ